MKNTFKLIISILACELTGGLGALFTTPSIATWYQTLPKPFLNPPAWIFGPVWTALFALMGIAVYLIWITPAKAVPKLAGVKQRIRISRQDALGIFAAQLIMNLLWSVIFFGLHAPGLAFLEIVTLWLAIIVTIGSFLMFSKPAAWLLVPYLLWVTFASYLNFVIWQGYGRAEIPSPPPVAGVQPSLPPNYSFDSYQIVETSFIACQKHADCVTPGRWEMMSNCPYVSLCLENKCAVVCPKPKASLK